MKNIMVSWNQYHSRNEALSKYLNLKCYYIGEKESNKFFSLLSYPFKIYSTIKLLNRVRPEIVVVTNTIFLLPLTVLILKIFLHEFKFVLDTHSCGIHNSIFAYPVFFRKFLARQANYSFVTNNDHKEIVSSWGGEAIVLPDPPLNLNKSGDYPNYLDPNKTNVMYISTYSKDEPYEEVIKAFQNLSDDYHLYITGKPNRKVNNACNITHTGYLSRQDYWTLLSYVDFALILTSRDNTFQCGANEALSLGKPFIVSNTKYLKEYYSACAVFTDNNNQDIRKKIIHLNNNINAYSKMVKSYNIYLTEQINEVIKDVREKLDEDSV